MLEENIAVFRASAQYRMLGIQCSGAEGSKRILVDHRSQLVVIPGFDLLNLMGSPEAVEEIQERNSSLDCGKMGDGAKIHNLLRIGARHHGKARLTAGIDVGMIAENIQSVRCDASCRHMNDARKQLSGDLIHVWDHQQQALRGRIRRRKRTGCKAAVYSAGRARLRLHFDYLYLIPENVFQARRGPGVRQLSHYAGRRDRVNTRYFRKRIADVCGGCIPVH